MAALHVEQLGEVTQITNECLKAIFTINPQGIDGEFFAKSGSEWRRIVTGFRPPVPYPQEGIALYDVSRDPSHRLLITEGLREIRINENGNAATVTLSGQMGEHQIEQRVTLHKHSDHFHMEVRIELAGSPPKLEYALSTFAFDFVGAPEFIHSPNLKFADDDVIGDRVFYSPAVILQHDALFMALVPDLDTINDCAITAPDARQVATGNAFSIPVDRSAITLPAALDLHLQSQLTPQPLVAYGLIDNIATHHMHWRHLNDGSMIRELESGLICYAFDIFLSADAPRFRGYQRISRFLWERYGTRYFHKPRPQAMPLAEYAQICYPASFAYRGSTVGMLPNGTYGAMHQAPTEYPELDSWLSWEIDGIPVGGYRNNAPQWYDLIGNTSFWNNARDAVALHEWGQRLHSADLLDKARRAVNLALAAPQRNGLFPTIYRFHTRSWQNNHWEPPMTLDPERVSLLSARYFDDNATSYHTASMSKTAAHLLRYYRRCTADPRIVPYVQKYADFLVNHIDENGCVPGWFSYDGQANPHLRFTSEVGIHVWFLAELSQITGSERYLTAVRQIAKFLADEILPRQRWLDTECYFSCGSKPMDYYDHFQGQEPRGTLPMFWASEGFAALFRATGDRRYLELGMQVLEYAAFYQAVWQPHYISTAYAFGGWATDNGDAAWLDARQGEVAEIFIWYGKLLGRQDLIERGIASARAGLVLVNHPRHTANDIYRYPNFPFGLGPENIDHEGFPQSTMRTDASWGEIAGLCGANDALQQLGGLYIDLSHNIAVGVDGVIVRQAILRGTELHIRYENALSQLPEPFEYSYQLDLRVAGLPSGKYNLILNGQWYAELQMTDGIDVMKRVEISPTVSP